MIAVLGGVSSLSLVVCDVFAPAAAAIIIIVVIKAPEGRGPAASIVDRNRKEDETFAFERPL